jgi:hypothetical protein
MPTRTAPEALADPVVVEAFLPVVLRTEEGMDENGVNLAVGATVGAFGFDEVSPRCPVAHTDIADGLGTVGFVAGGTQSHGVKHWSIEASAYTKPLENARKNDEHSTPNA